MVHLNDLHQLHIKAFKDLDRFEELIDNKVKQAWRENPLGTFFTLRFGTEITKDHIAALAKKYADNGWTMDYYNFPVVVFQVAQPQKFAKTIKELLTGTAKEEVAKVPRAIKIVELPN